MADDDAALEVVVAGVQVEVDPGDRAGAGARADPDVGAELEGAAVVGEVVVGACTDWVVVPFPLSRTYGASAMPLRYSCRSPG